MGKPFSASQVRVVRQHKHGNLPEEYEDASAVSSNRACFAIADGASESAFAGAWARLLVDGLVGMEAAGPVPFKITLAQLRERWTREVTGQPLAWYAEAKAESGAFATLLGLWFEERRIRLCTRLCWHAWAIGDACLFQVRDDALLASFPMQRSSEMTNTPFLVGSTTELPPGSEQRCRNRDLRTGDHFWLMTDALGAWFLESFEKGEKPWRELAKLCTSDDAEETFQQWIARQRELGTLHNDDVTLIAIQV